MKRAKNQITVETDNYPSLQQQRNKIINTINNLKKTLI